MHGRRVTMREACLVWAVLAFVFLGISHPAQSTEPIRDDVFAVVAEYGAQYLNDTIQCPGLINAQLILHELDDFTVIDMRSESAFEGGHVPGAYHSSLSTLLDDLGSFIPNDKPYVITGYTGQVASQAKFAMELMGYDDVYCMLYGMSSWNYSLDHWSNNCNDLLANPETQDQNSNLEEQAYPILEGDAATIIAQRVEAMLADGYRGRSYASIMDNLEDYFIINYVGQADYLGQGAAGVPGHIPGSFQFSPYSSMDMEQMLNNIPTDRPVVICDWTGHHSSQVVAYLNLLGYDAYNLNFGFNSLFYSELLYHRWTSLMANDFPLEEGAMSSAPEHVAQVAIKLGNYPNPFNPTTSVFFALEKAGPVTLTVYDLTGRRIKTLLSEVNYAAGDYEVVWDGRNDQGRPLPSGSYFCRMQSGSAVTSHRLTLLK